MKHNKNSKFYQYYIKYFNKNRKHRTRVITIYETHPDKILHKLLNQYKMKIQYTSPSSKSDVLKAHHYVPSYMCIETVLNNIPFIIVLDRNSCIEVLINTTYEQYTSTHDNTVAVPHAYTHNFHPKGNNIFEEEPEIRFNHPHISTNEILNNTLHKDNINTITEEELFQLSLLVPEPEQYIVAYNLTKHLMDYKVNNSNSTVLYALSTINEFIRVGSS